MLAAPRRRDARRVLSSARSASGSRDVDVELARVGVVHRRGHVRPSGRRSAGPISSAAASTTAVSLVDQVEGGAEAIEREQLGERRSGSLAVLACRPSAASASSRCSGVELGGGVELDPLGLAERALGEGREPADRLDLVAEQLEPRRALLGRAEDVEDAAADRELAALVDLVDALVARPDEQLGDVAEVDLLAAVRAKPAGRSEASGTASASATALATTTGGSRRRRRSPVSASSAAIRRPTRCGGGARWDS